MRLTLDDLAGLELTYPEHGATRQDPMPAGYHAIMRSAELGRGVELFQRAGEAVMTWQVQERAGLVVTPASPRAVTGTDVLMRLGLGPLGVDIPCRVVYQVCEPDAIGYAYGTLPGHPECGEESFIVQLDDDERVRLSVRAFSRPGNLLARLGGPLSTAAQSLMTRRYLNTLQHR